jgi:hypothetical protein
MNIRSLFQLFETDVPARTSMLKNCFEFGKTNIEKAQK